MFDAFELEIVVEYNMHDGTTACEPWHGTVEDVIAEVAENDDAIGWFYTIYGHIPGRGVESLIDIAPEKPDYAHKMFDFFCDMLEKSKKFEKLKEILLT